ncbi:hypothetical protein L198_01616 [Cryptococcus wingfieldii CBS 7118]|uniref:Uncharacterized protein n=1 Tax=Cryptococcus wingfieldii CBS 7118 TaxID=1295528 RepID=A0A1E3JZT7_9TREE|nr:hypothetical protein L198_01616 [Cryptococcus wingfieldii CBS 7118]ODO06384.1 hypothetical protein L198_01616 [Cryptococcus wingfieldii CBS 7118]
MPQSSRHTTSVNGSSGPRSTHTNTQQSRLQRSQTEPTFRASGHTTLDSCLRRSRRSNTTGNVKQPVRFSDIDKVHYFWPLEAASRRIDDDSTTRNEQPTTEDSRNLIQDPAASYDDVVARPEPKERRNTTAISRPSYQDTYEIDGIDMMAMATEEAMKEIIPSMAESWSGRKTGIESLARVTRTIQEDDGLTLGALVTMTTSGSMEERERHPQRTLVISIRMTMKGMIRSIQGVGGKKVDSVLNPPGSLGVKCLTKLTPQAVRGERIRASQNREMRGIETISVMMQGERVLRTRGVMRQHGRHPMTGRLLPRGDLLPSMRLAHTPLPYLVVAQDEGQRHSWRRLQRLAVLDVPRQAERWRREQARIQ